MIKNTILLFFTVLFLCSCAGENNASVPSPTENIADAEYKKISAEEAYSMMEEATDFILLDVRTEDEYAEKRINGAILIPDYEISSRVEAELPDKNALIFVYCRSGRRSANAVNEMIGLGYSNIYDFGGINDWPYDTVSE